MTKLRTGDPWMSAAEYGRSLRGLTVNLLVSDVERSLAFSRQVLAAEIVYSDPDIAVICFFLNDDRGGATHSLFNVKTEPTGIAALGRRLVFVDRLLS